MININLDLDLEFVLAIICFLVNNKIKISTTKGGEVANRNNSNKINNPGLMLRN